MSLLLKIVNHYGLFLGINDPAFPNSCCTVFKQLYAIIPLRIRRGSYFNDPIRRSIAAVFIQLIPVANDRNIRLNVVFLVRIQKYRKRSRIDLAGSAVGIDILPDYFCELAYNLLMHPSWQIHIVNLPINQFGSLAFRQGINIFYGITAFLP